MSIHSISFSLNHVYYKIIKSDIQSSFKQSTNSFNHPLDHFIIQIIIPLPYVNKLNTHKVLII